MKKSYPYLNDAKFLIEIANIINPVYYVQISLLNQQEELERMITGKTVSASINIDGKSAVRRTANLSFVMEDKDPDAQSLLQLNKKVYLEIGYQNSTNRYKEFPIIWFPLGMYIVTAMSFSHGLTGTNFNLSLKDKMCLLNGQCGGTLSGSITFDNYDAQNETGEMVVVRPTIYQIITELVNHFGGQQLGNIIISDVDTRIRKVMEWNGSVPLYVLEGGNNGGYFVTTDEVDAANKIESGLYSAEPGSPFEKGSNIGYTLTDFTYPGDLIGNAGESVVTILDKIKNTLGNYEYFYDLEGHFRFQEIKNYLNNSLSKYMLEALNKQPPQFVLDYLDPLGGLPYQTQRINGKAVFSFKENEKLVISYSNTPQIQNIKNDFVIWGIRKGVTDEGLPIRYHLAIDKKPQVGNTYDVIKYVDFYDNKTEQWYRPLRFRNKDFFPEKGLQGVVYYDNQNSKAYAWKYQDNVFDYVQIDATLQSITTTDWRTQLYFQGVAAEPLGLESNFYYRELKFEWPKIYDIQHGKFKDQIVNDIGKMDYYLDFINPVSEAARKISVENIGRRSMVINKNDDVNCVFEPHVPDVVLIKLDYSMYDEKVTEMEKMRRECDQKGYNYCQVNEDVYNYLVPGLRFNSGYEEVRQLLYQYINYNESVNIQTLPLYFLEPNTCIEIQDQNSFIKGNYVINTLAFSLDTASSLTINASKLLERF